MQPYCQELLKQEERDSGKTIVGMIYHVDGCLQEIRDLNDLLGEGMLHVKVRSPPAQAEDFYKCCDFRLNDADAKVHIMERGKHSLLNLRFLPDEEKEAKIRNQDFGAITAGKVRGAIEELKEKQDRAQRIVEGKRMRFQARFQTTSDKAGKLEQDCCVKFVVCEKTCVIYTLLLRFIVLLL